jgi:hypothetical protein
MAETPFPNDPALAEETDEPQEDLPERASAEINALEAIELNRLRRDYTRASSHRPEPNTLSQKPTTLIGRTRYGIKRFWMHQISIKVDHHTCRDHLGMFFLKVYLSLPYVL